MSIKGTGVATCQHPSEVWRDDPLNYAMYSSRRSAQPSANLASFSPKWRIRLIWMARQISGNTLLDSGTAWLCNLGFYRGDRAKLTTVMTDLSQSFTSLFVEGYQTNYSTSTVAVIPQISPTVTVLALVLVNAGIHFVAPMVCCGAGLNIANSAVIDQTQLQAARRQQQPSPMLSITRATTGTI